MPVRNNHTPAGGAQSVPVVSSMPLGWTKEFSVSGSQAGLLKPPLEIAAKWGGFHDQNQNGRPDQQVEWDSDNDGVPDNYFYVANPAELWEYLDRAFSLVLQRQGTAGAVATVTQEVQQEDVVVRAAFESFSQTNPSIFSWIGHMESYIPYAGCAGSDNATCRGLGGCTWNNAASTCSGNIYSFQWSQNHQSILCRCPLHRGSLRRCGQHVGGYSLCFPQHPYLCCQRLDSPRQCAKSPISPSLPALAPRRWWPGFRAPTATPPCAIVTDGNSGISSTPPRWWLVLPRFQRFPDNWRPMPSALTSPTTSNGTRWFMSAPTTGCSMPSIWDSGTIPLKSTCLIPAGMELLPSARNAGHTYQATCFRSCSIWLRRLTAPVVAASTVPWWICRLKSGMSILTVLVSGEAWWWEVSAVGEIPILPSM